MICIVAQQVFNKWKSKDVTRVSEFNYERIIRLLVEEGLVEDAMLALKDMNDIHGMQASSAIYDLIIHGFIEKSRFKDASEFSRAGLIKRMERTFRFVMSKKMDLEGLTMVAMLEAYANFGDLEKMEKVYRKVLRLKPKVYLNDDLIQKVATVYIENFIFSRLHDMGINLYSRTGNNIAWCLRMLAHACLLSRAGMESVVREMDYKKVKWSVTIANIMLFAYAKMEDFGHFKVVLLEMEARNVKPDIVTCGILFDTHWFNGSDSWKKTGFFDDVVEFKTDPLVLVAFGKGDFLKTVEELDDTKSKNLMTQREKFGHMSI
nr:hypothetical protein [Tanacetum cinerariifolium]